MTSIATQIELPTELVTLTPSALRSMCLEKMQGISNFVPLDPSIDPFDGGTMNNETAARIFPCSTTMGDRPSLLRACSRGGQGFRGILGIEFSQYIFRLKVDDLTGKVVVLGQLRVKARAEAVRLAVLVHLPYMTAHVGLIPYEYLHNNSAFEKRGGWLELKQKIEKADSESLDDFWVRCRGMPKVELDRIWEGSDAGRRGC